MENKLATLHLDSQGRYSNVARKHFSIFWLANLHHYANSMPHYLAILEATPVFNTAAAALLKAEKKGWKCIKLIYTPTKTRLFEPQPYLTQIFHGNCLLIRIDTCFFVKVCAENWALEGTQSKLQPWPKASWLYSEPPSSQQWGVNEIKTGVTFLSILLLLAVVRAFVQGTFILFSF